MKKQQKEYKIDLQILEGGKRQTKTLEQMIEIHSRIIKNELPLLYISHKNSAIIVNYDEYLKKKELLRLYRNLAMETEVEERSKYWKKIDEIEDTLNE